MAAGAEVVLVCGAGAAGMAAALAAARAGARVVLAEASPRTGGTVADCLIHTLGGLYGPDGGPLNGGLAEVLVAALTREDPATRPRQLGRLRVLNVCPDVYRAVTRRWLNSEPGLTVLCGARAERVTTRGGRVCAVTVRHAAGGEEALRVRAVVDATGTAEVVRLLDGDLVEGEDAPLAAGGVVLRLRGVAPGALAFPRGAALNRALRAAAGAGELPAEAGKAWLDSGARLDEAFLKLFVPLPEGWRRLGAEVRQAALTTGAASSTSCAAGLSFPWPASSPPGHWAFEKVGAFAGSTA